MGDRHYGNRFFCGFILFRGNPGLYVAENEGKSFSPLILYDHPYVSFYTVQPLQLIQNCQMAYVSLFKSDVYK
jgi:hypothetical protein